MMKKTLLSIAFCVLVGFLSAQSLQFELDGAPCTKVICETAEWGIMNQEMALHNLTGETINVVVEKEEIQIMPETQNYFCWGMCYDPSVVIGRPVPLEGNTVSEPNALSFHHMVNEIPGTNIVRYHAYPDGQPENRVTVEVWFANNATNVSEDAISFGKAYPNPASTTVRFDIQNAGNNVVTATIYNLLGQEIMSQTVSDMQSRIEFPVSHLQPGIYFCNFNIGGVTRKTEKFIVK